MYIYVCVCIYESLYKYRYECINRCIHMYVCVCIYKCLHKYVYICINKYIHINVYRYRYIHIYTHICVYVYIYIRDWVPWRVYKDRDICMFLSLALSRSLSLFEILKKAAVGLCSRSIILNPTICKDGLPFLAFSAFRFSEAILDITDALCDMSVRTISIDIWICVTSKRRRCFGTIWIPVISIRPTELKHQ